MTTVERETIDIRFNQLEAILDGLPEALIAVAKDGSILYQNQTATDWLKGLSEPAELEYWPEQFGFYLDDGKTYFPGKSMPMMRALNGESVPVEEMVLRPPNASSGFWISMSAQPLKDHTGEINGAIVAFRDITYRKQVEISHEKHARRAEALYKLSYALSEAGSDLNRIFNIVTTHTTESIGDACILTLAEEDERLKIAAVHHPNPNANALLREYMLSNEFDVQQDIISAVFLSGEPLLIPTIIPSQKELFFRQEYGKYLEEVGVESLLVVPIKGQQNVLGTLRVTRDHGGRPYSPEDQTLLLDISRRTAQAIENCYLLESLRQEIQERHKAEKALAESEDRFRSIFVASALGIILLDLNGGIIQTNAAFQTMIGSSEAELIGHRFTEFIPKKNAATSLRLFHNLAQCKTTEAQFENRFTRPDGELIWVQATFAGVKGSEDDCFSFIVAMVENITERKKMELELVETKARFLSHGELERLQIAQELHDGPMQDLHSVIFQIEGQHDQIDPAEKTKLDEIRKAISQVIQELRTTAKELRPPTITNFGLEKAIRSHVEDFMEKYPDLEIHLALASDRQFLPEEVRLALFRIYQQSVMNVVRHAGASRLDIRFTFDAEEVRLEIEDNGDGFAVPPRWITLLRQGHYGLAGSAERVAALNGSFEVSSQPNKGTSVRVVIPRTWEG